MGVESLIRTAIAARVGVCFANPGTAEMPLVAALDAADGLRAVLGLFEGVCTGAADGYGRMRGLPALTLLHLGPGFANGIANLHNARRARSPIVNVIGDHATWHAAADAPLASDIRSLARPVSGWVRSVRSATAVGDDTAEAVAAAGRFPGQIATLIVPADCQWDTAEGPAKPIERAAFPAVSDAAIKRTAEVFRGGGRVALLLGSSALAERGLAAVARIAAKSQCRLVCETFPARVERGAGLPSLERLPYFPEQAIEALSTVDSIVLAGAKSPVAFFGYPNMPSSLVPEGRKVTMLAEPTDDVVSALEALAEAIGAPRVVSPAAKVVRPGRPSGKLNAATVRGGAGRADARERDHHGRSGDDRVAVLWRIGGSAAPQLFGAYGRRDRAGLAVRDGRCGRMSGPQGNRVSGGRQRHVHAAIVLDAGA